MSSGFLTIEQAAKRYQRTPKALYDFIARRSWLPGVMHFGRRILIDPIKFEGALERKPDSRKLRRVS